MDPYQGAVSQEVRTWQQRFCHTASCLARLLFVQRCAEHPDLWRVALQPDAAGWVVAAVAPLCPWCGGDLAARPHLARDLDLERQRCAQQDVETARA